MGHDYTCEQVGGPSQAFQNPGLMSYLGNAMANYDSFSKRNRYSGPPKEISIREDAPQNLRYFVLQAARDLGWQPSSLRDTLCRVLRQAPDSSNWSEFPNIWNEVEGLMYGAKWYKVYDIIESLYAKFRSHDSRTGDQDAPEFARALNEYFIDEGIGWQLVDGQIATRGTEAFESVVAATTTSLKASGRPTAANHLHEALNDLSRRPQADYTGAIYHSMGALESVARDICGDQKATLGEIAKRYPELFPKPLDTALAQVWGHVSNEARHVREGKDATRREAELIVGLSAALAGYLIGN